MDGRIRMVIEESGLSTRKFAEKIGVSPATVSQFANGKSKLQPDTRKLICKEFNINEEWILTGEGDMHAPLSRDVEIGQIAASLVNDRNDMPFVLDVVKILQKMDQNQWNMLFDVAKKLTEIHDKYEEKEKGAE